MLKTLLLSVTLSLSIHCCFAQNLVTGSYIRPSGNTVNFYHFNFIDYAAYTGGDKQINIIADGNASHFRMPNVNYQARLGVDAALGRTRRRHGIGVAGDFRSMGGNHLGGAQVSYAFQVVDREKVQLRIGIMGGVEFLKRNSDDNTYGDMIDDRYGYIYPTIEPLAHDNTLFIVPRFAAGIWFRAYGFGLAFNADCLIPMNVGTGGDAVMSTRFSALAYYQVRIGRIRLMPSVSFLHYGSGYRVEGGISLYGKPEKGFLGGVFGSSRKDLRMLVGYNVLGRFKVYAGMTFYFDGLASIFPIHDGFGGMNLNFLRYGK